MSRKGDISPPFLLEPERIREILRKGSDALMLSAEDHLVERAAKLIESMREDLVKLMNLPLKNVEIFRARESLTLKEIEEFYSSLDKKPKTRSLSK